MELENLNICEANAQEYTQKKEQVQKRSNDRYETRLSFDEELNPYQSQVVNSSKKPEKLKD